MRVVGEASRGLWGQGRGKKLSCQRSREGGPQAASRASTDAERSRPPGLQASSAHRACRKEGQGRGDLNCKGLGSAAGQLPAPQSRQAQLAKKARPASQGRDTAHLPCHSHRRYGSRFFSAGVPIVRQMRTPAKGGGETSQARASGNRGSDRHRLASNSHVVSLQAGPAVAARSAPAAAKGAPAPSIIFWPLMTALMGRTSAWEAGEVMPAPPAGVLPESREADACGTRCAASSSEARSRAAAAGAWGARGRCGRARVAGARRADLQGQVRGVWCGAGSSGRRRQWRQATDGKRQWCKRAPSNPAVAGPAGSLQGAAAKSVEPRSAPGERHAW